MKHKNSEIKEIVFTQYKNLLTGIFTLILFGTAIFILTSHVKEKVKSVDAQVKIPKKLVVLPTAAPITPQTFTYTVQEGDSLSKISKVFCNNEREYLQILESNNMSEKAALHPGDKIIIPCNTDFVCKNNF